MAAYMSPSFKNYTGKGIRIAVLDSGVNVYHSHINQPIIGQSFRANREGYLEVSPDIRDFLGHGTAVTAVIRYMAPDAEILAGKIFDEKLACYPSVLAEAIHWAVDSNVHVINLSLGVRKDHAVIKEACEYAHEHNIAVVAAIDRQNDFVYPAQYENVLRLFATEIDRNLWRMEEKDYIAACGVPRELPENVQIYNLHGHSFAAPHFSAWIARYLESIGGGGLQEVKDFIEKEAYPLCEVVNDTTE